MADYNYGGSDEENNEIRKLNLELDVDSDNFELWEKLLYACEALEGGLGRNSSPQALETMRNTYDRVLLKFPLLFGYWKKYADFEFTITGPEAAELVYERGCASITNSVDLWTQFCSFKMETTHEPQPVREVFERAVENVGTDFLSHPLWDKYIEYEGRMEAGEQIFAILKRVIKIPMHQYSRYYERYHQMSQLRPVAELVSEDVLAHLRAETVAEDAQYANRSDAELEVVLRPKVDALLYSDFMKTQEETTKRWTYEAEIKRPYFHVTKLDHSQLANWRKYLDFEEAEGDFARVVFLYERCLVTCAYYDEFWFRYARWMSGQAGKEEDVRNIYLRASTLFVPISRPAIRLQFAYFEESCGRAEYARAIHNAVIEILPNSVEAILSLANLERRQAGLDAAIEVFKQTIAEPQVDIYTKAALVAEWAFLLWKVKGSVADARTVFVKNVQYYADSRQFWVKWLEFELAQSLVENKKEKKDKKDKREKETVEDRLEQVMLALRTHSHLPIGTKRELCQVYMTYLQQRGGKDSMKKFLAIDREFFGPASVSFSAIDKPEPLVDMDATAAEKATLRYRSFFETYEIPDPALEGPADFE